MTIYDNCAADIALVELERDILARVAQGGALENVLADLISLVETPSRGEMKASILFLSGDEKHLLHGSAPSLPEDYNRAIDGISIGPSTGSCGTTAFFGKPTFVEDIASDPLWADFRELALSHGLRACWSVPIFSSDGRVLGTFANYYPTPKHPTDRDIRVVQMVAQTAAIAIERHRHDLARARLDDQRELLLRELNHRVKNVFALANSILVMTARGTSNPDDLVKSVQGRLQALSRAHEFVRPGSAGVELNPAADILFEQVVRDILAPYYIRDMEGRVHLGGPKIRICAEVVTPIALVIHELATNAAKYGALSVASGTVDVSWTTGQDHLEISWTERGGPAVVKPDKTGFGTTLARRSTENQMGGTIDYRWQEEGLMVSIAIPLETIRGSKPSIAPAHPG